ncbi:SGNH hydrolase-type esterase domain-containing protein [Geranomyces variabilis]|nr:SGNH hydrolase-type esterase domain-containing protein [Geranomyces variabilis]KAJ3135068.1 hypothetical protein HDU90_004096 [Geranomyces variabilis]
MTEPQGKWKQRTADTHTRHMQQLATPHHHHHYTIILLGDSMLERFTTTGRATSISQNPHIFNAGCGGDKVDNVLYRLEHGLLDRLPAVEKVVLHCGTKNLAGRGKKKTLKMGAGYIPAYRAMLRMIVAHYRARGGDTRTSTTTTSMMMIPHLFITGLFYREATDAAEIDRVNAMLKALAEEEEEEQEECVQCTYIPPFETTLVDHVHMDAASYAKWDAVLVPILGL